MTISPILAGRLGPEWLVKAFYTKVFGETLPPLEFPPAATDHPVTMLVTRSMDFEHCVLAGSRHFKLREPKGYLPVGQIRSPMSGRNGKQYYFGTQGSCLPDRFVSYNQARDLSDQGPVKFMTPLEYVLGCFFKCWLDAKPYDQESCTVLDAFWSDGTAVAAYFDGKGIAFISLPVGDSCEISDIVVPAGIRTVTIL